LLAVGDVENRLHPELVLSSLDMSNKGVEGWALPGAPLCERACASAPPCGPNCRVSVPGQGTDPGWLALGEPLENRRQPDCAPIWPLACDPGCAPDRVIDGPTLGLVGCPADGAPPKLRIGARVFGAELPGRATGVDGCWLNRRQLAVGTAVWLPPWKEWFGRAPACVFQSAPLTEVRAPAVAPAVAPRFAVGLRIAR